MENKTTMIMDNYICNSVTLARYIAGYANAHNFVINMTKLQKLLYITYGVYLAVKGQRLTDEHPQAWPYGPVFPTARNKLLKSDLHGVRMPEDKTLDNDVRSCVALVFKTYGAYNATYLSSWSHRAGSPWGQTVNGIGFTWGDRIPDEYIMDYFKSNVIAHGK